MKEGGWMKKIETLNQKLVFSLDCFSKVTIFATRIVM